jgi:putative ABC transport system permease protein
MFESAALALIGGTVGASTAYFAFDGFKASTINWQTFSQIAFAFTVTPMLLVEGVLIAVSVGFLGGLFPAMRAARLPIAMALRES